MENFSINDKQDLDYDLPNFTSTKYNSTNWKLCHGTTYFLFSFGYLTSSVLIFTQGKALDDTTIFASEIANVFGSCTLYHPQSNGSTIEEAASVYQISTVISRQISINHARPPFIEVRLV